MYGHVAYFNTVKGFGFIIDREGEKYFFHVTDILNQGEIQIESRVFFYPGTDKKGLRAEEVEIL